MGQWSTRYGSQATRCKTYVGKVTNWFDRIGVAEVQVESGMIRRGERLLIQGPTTGCIEFDVDDMRVELKSADEAPKGCRCSIAVPLDGQPEDRINAHPAMAPQERIHPRRGDKVYVWVLQA